MTDWNDIDYRLLKCFVVYAYKYPWYLFDFFQVNRWMVNSFVTQVDPDGLETSTLGLNFLVLPDHFRYVRIKRTKQPFFTFTDCIVLLPVLGTWPQADGEVWKTRVLCCLTVQGGPDRKLMVRCGRQGYCTVYLYLPVQGGPDRQLIVRCGRQGNCSVYLYMGTWPPADCEVWVTRILYFLPVQGTWPPADGEVWGKDATNSRRNHSFS